MSPALQERIVQEDWSEGEVQDVAPALISPAGAARMVNVLLDEDGNPYRRGGTTYVSKEGLGSSGLSWLWAGYLKPGPRTLVANGSDFGVLGSDGESIVNLGGVGLSVPKQAAALQDLLYIGGGTLYGGSRKSAVYSTGTVTVTNGSKVVTGSGTTWNTLVDAGMLLQIGSERAYVVASVDATSQITLRDAYQGATGGGKSYSLNPVLSASSGPYGTWDYVTVCANRFVFVAGRTIKFTEVNNPHTFTNSKGTTNEHTLPEGEGIGLRSVGQTALIFTTAGIWTLDGLALDIVDAAGNPQHRLEQLSGDTVLAGASGLAASGQQLVVPGGDGIYLMDGVSQPRLISRPVNRTYRRYIADGYRLGRAVVYRNHYFLPIVSGTAKVKALLVCRLDRPTRDREQVVYPWCHFTGDGGDVPALAVRASTDPQQPELLGVQSSEPSRVVDCSGYFDPSAANKNDADGSTFDLDIVSRDYETGSGTINSVRAVRPRYELVDAASDDPELQISYATGSATSGGARFGHATFGNAKFGSDLGASFVVVGNVGTSDGRNPVPLRMKPRARYMRVRIKGVGPAARCALRSLSLSIRPSGAVRR